MATFENQQLEERLQEWMSDKYDEKTRQELKALVDAGDVSELEDRFYRSLEFGTGGLRGKLGAGINRMNQYIVARATQGLATYVKEHAEKPGPLRVAITHDCRHCAREFAEVSAEVLAANGFTVYISPELRPTPYLSFAVRELNCHTGIVITASHNPKEYNGYKCYWDDGSQVVPPHDIGIIDEVAKVDSDALVKRIPYEQGLDNGSIIVMGDEMDRAFLKAVKLQRIAPEVIREFQPKVVFTPLHGVGGTLIPAALKDWGFNQVLTEPEQMIPNGDFPTAASPNPEEGAALDRAIQLGKAQGADLVMATDPDADRLGIAVNHQGEFKLVTGNQLCALLGDHLLSKYKSPEGKQLGIVTTIVTSPLLEKIAKSYGAACELTLTGFKWIAAVIREWEKDENAPDFIYGTEESYGYLIGKHCRDKDGVVASCCTAELAAHARKAGRTLIDEIYALYEKHGVHHEWQKSIVMPGVEGSRKMAALMDNVRDNPPCEVCGSLYSSRHG
jgi:phosphoglucomutase